ncbi:SphA family protein [Pseudomonas sp. C5pp]|uniref:SphA family protein n=1 Tax=Pseudomonas sp. C5pp TaxID=1586081 RepID=UPI00057E3D28|nr:transporter [Pseudomonas sp. C5pp]KIC79248.1 signal peptide protein [Pseudomonas sp. C5pp]
MKTCSFAASSLLFAGLAATLHVSATEGGKTLYALGVNGFGWGALPPPGTYMMLDAQHYRSDDLKGNDGSSIPVPGFKVRADALVPNFIWVTSQELLGGSLALHSIVPLVTLDVSAAGRSQRKTGVGDIVFGPAIGWHLSPNLHTVAGIDIFAPTGEYDKDDLANVGGNYWATHMVGGFSWIDVKGFNADAKVMYGINARNDDTDYRSGNELIVDYAAGWALGNGWTVGVGGYVYQQLTDDEQDGHTVRDNKGSARAIGPSVRYDSGQGWFLTVKGYGETGVRNRAEGDALWLRAVFPL